MRAYAEFEALSRVHGTGVSGRLGGCFDDSPEAVAVVDAVSGKIVYANDALSRLLEVGVGEINGTRLDALPGYRGSLLVETREIGDHRIAVVSEAGSVRLPHEIVLVFGADGSVRYESPSYEELTGLRAADSGMCAGDFLSGEPGRAAGTTEVEVLHADGTPLWIECLTGGLAGLRGETVVVGRDVTAGRAAAGELLRSEEQYRALVQNSSEIVKICAADGTLRYISPSVEAILGYRPQDVIGSSVLDFVHPDDLALVVEETRESLERSGLVRSVAEYRYLHADGSWRHMETTGTYLLDDPVIQGVLISTRDITDRKEAEFRLEEAESRYRTLVEEVPSITYTCRQLPGEGIRITYISPQVEVVLGYTPDEYVRDGHWQKILHPDDREKVLSVEVRAGERGSEFGMEFRMISASGQVVWIRESGRVIHEEDDGSLTWQGVMLDITSLKETEISLREAEERYRNLVEHVPGISYVEDLETGHTLYDSPQIADVLGYPPDLHLAEPDYWRGITHPDDIETVLRAEQEALESGGNLCVEYRVYAADGRVVWLRDEAALVVEESDEGEVAKRRWNGFLLDITARKEAEAALHESEVRYREQARELELLHRVRTTIAGVMDAQEVLRTVVEEIAKTYGYNQVSAYLIESGRESGRRGAELVLQHQVGYERVIERLSLSTGVMGRTARTGESQLIEAALQDRDFVGAFEGIVSEVCVPLRGGEGEVFGVLNVESTDGVVLGGRDLRVAEALAEHIGAAVGTARLHSRLSEAERRYRSIIERISVATYVRSPQRRDATLYMSPQIEAITGYPPEKFESAPTFWMNCIHPEDRDGVTKRSLESHRTREPFSMEYRTVHRDGTVRWVLNEAVFSEDGEWQGVVIDVTDHKLAEITLRESEERFRTLMQNGSDLIAILDRTGNITYISPSIHSIQGQTAATRMGQNAFQEIHPDDREAVLQNFARLSETPGSEATEVFRLRHRDGSWVYLESVGRNLLEDPAVGGIVINARDITARKRAEKAFEESEGLLTNVVSAAPVILFATDSDGVITLARGRGMEPLNVGDVVGTSVFEMYRYLPRVLDNVRCALGGEDVATTVEIGESFYDARYSPIRGERGEVVGVIGVATDITERLRLERELEYRAFHDPLTGLANRALGLDRISHALERCSGRRNSSLAILFMDLDDFKVVNDSLGHHTGDDLLVKVSERLGDCLRGGDTLARLGGDEFVMILEDAGLSGAVSAARRVEESLMHPFFIGEEEHERFVTASIGITVSRNGVTNAEDLLREADLAMYLAKDGGKARYGVFDSELGARAVARVELEGELRRALKHSEFEVYYQPVVGCSDGRTKGFEALVRWRHPERGMVPPGDFIGLMEETGLIIGLGKFVLEESCRALAGWRKELPGAESLFVCVNLSARQFLHPGLPDEISGALRLSGLDAGGLYLEITENVAMSDDFGTATLAGLRELGVGLMIDDFGTGHSSLAYLKQLPLDCLKIDRSFSSGVGKERIDEEIVAAIVQLGHAVGLCVVAEGVETELQMARLRELGCDQAQGFYISRPIREERVPGLLLGDDLPGT